jgi:hypothetical protein
MREIESRIVNMLVPNSKSLLIRFNNTLAALFISMALHHFAFWVHYAAENRDSAKIDRFLISIGFGDFLKI